MDDSQETLLSQFLSALLLQLAEGAGLSQVTLATVMVAHGAEVLENACGRDLTRDYLRVLAGAMEDDKPAETEEAADQKEDEQEQTFH